ncbi:MAG: exodeoxyribonuclease VII large subunit [Agriterribacter sp.]
MSMTELEQHIKLSDLNKKIQAVIEKDFNELTFWVIADITNHSFKEQTNYHYFEMVEKADNSNQLVAKIAGKAWGNGASKIREFERITGQRFTNNINVLVKVKIIYHVTFGLSLDIQDIDTNFTIGVLEQQRQATLAALVKNNPAVIAKVGDRYITRNGKLSLPMAIQRIALVASKTSAGNEDFKHTLLNNPYGYKFEIHDYHTVVQNEANAQQFLERLIDVFKSNYAYDVIIITRGGGAQTDFLIFDNYKIGLAVAKFPIPIITGIGHQKNETIADLMAHTQTKTPTKAAEFIIAHNKKFEDDILNFQKTVLIKSQQMFSSYYQKLTTLNTSIVNNSRTFLSDYKDALVNCNQTVVNKTKTILFHNKTALSLSISTLISKPKIIVGNKLNDLSNTMNNIKSFNAAYLRNQRGYLGHLVSVINLMSPTNILKKGFAIIKYKGDVTSNPEVFNAGSEMEVILSDKSIKSVVKSKSNYDGNDFNI